MSDARLETRSASMPFAGLAVLKLTRAEKDCLCAAVAVGAEHCKAGSIADGGFLMTQADCAGAGRRGADRDR